MGQLVLASLFLPLSHFGISSTSLRGRLLATVGEQPYLGLYSLVSAVAFFWLVVSYRHAPIVVLWVPPPALIVAMIAVVFVAFLLAVVGILTPNPTTVGAEALFDRPDVARGIVRVTRNPFLWGVGLWAVAHVVAMGDLASVLLFASIGSLGLAGAPLLDAKKARQQGARWDRFAAATSSMPFAAIASGRQRLVVGELGLWRVAVALAAFALVLAFHRRLFGVSPLAMF
jgi:uncharacterized membrane protein